MRAQLKALQSRLATTVLYVTHNLAEAVRKPDPALPKAGWVVEIRGYTYHGDKYTFVLNTFVENLIDLTDLDPANKRVKNLKLPKETEFAAHAAAALVGLENVNRNPTPAMGSEDFAWMLLKKPGCYIWIGNGDGEGTCMVHNPGYDFNDEILPIGASYWATLVEQQLGRQAMPQAAE